MRWAVSPKIAFGAFGAVWLIFCRQSSTIPCGCAEQLMHACTVGLPVPFGQTLLVQQSMQHAAFQMQQLRQCCNALI